MDIPAPPAANNEIQTQNWALSKGTSSATNIYTKPRASKVVDVDEYQQEQHSRNLETAHGFIANYAPSVNTKDVYSGLTTGFYFKRRTERLDWRLLASRQVDRVQREVDILALQEIMENVMVCDLDSEGDSAFRNAIKIAQLIIEYLIHTQDYLAASQGTLSKDPQDTSDRLALLKATYEKQKTLYAYQLMARVPGHAPDTPNNDVAKNRTLFKSRAYLDNHMIRRHPDNMHQYQQQYPPQNQPYIQQNYPQNPSFGAGGMQQPGEPSGPPPWWPQQGGFSRQPDSNNAAILDLVSKATLNSSYEQERLKHDEEIQGLKTAILKQLSEEHAQFEEEKAALKEVLKKADERSRFGSLEDDDLCPNPLSEAAKSKDIAATPEAALKVEDQINKMKKTMTADHIFALREALLQEHQLNKSRELEVKKLLSASAVSSSNAVAKGIMGAAGVAGAVGLAQTLLASQKIPQSNAIKRVMDGLKTAAAIAGAAGMLMPGTSHHDPSNMGAIANAVLSVGHEQKHGIMGNAGNAMAAAAGAAAVAGLAHSMMGGQSHEKPVPSSAITTMSGALLGGAKNEQSNGIIGNLGQAMSNASAVSDAVGMANSLMGGEAPTSAQLGTLANKNKNDTSTDSSDDAPLSTLFASKKAEKARISATEGSFGDSSDDAPLSSLKPKSPKKNQPDELSAVSDTPGQPRKNFWPLVGLASTVTIAASSPRLMSLLMPGADDISWTTALEMMQAYQRNPLQQAPWIKTLYPQNESQAEKDKRLIMQNVDKTLISRGIQGSEMLSQWYRPEVQASFEAATDRFATDIKQKDKSSRIYKNLALFARKNTLSSDPNIISRNISQHAYQSSNRTSGANFIHRDASSTKHIT
ncbi:Iguana/Dzip1-like DAZ-interacting protein N-terminal-domain-containing protein [Chytriomyces cf. hyalinus JEL632]|nr:Iguana/Dzip1-like DAZ-interacting protein N-terminal-domain-containing protein [Chytriomyces cf. hyalinus JEL632]